MIKFIPFLILYLIVSTIFTLIALFILGVELDIFMKYVVIESVVTLVLSLLVYPPYRYYINRTLFITSYTKLNSQCIHMNDLGVYKDCGISNHWSNLHYFLNKYIINLANQKVYTTPYHYVFNNIALYYADTALPLYHMSKEIDILNRLNCIDFLAKNKMNLYDNSYIESDEIVKNRWTLFLNHLPKESDVWDKLSKKYNKRFSESIEKDIVVEKEQKKVIDHLSNDFMKERSKPLDDDIMKERLKPLRDEYGMWGKFK